MINDLKYQEENIYLTIRYEQTRITVKKVGEQHMLSPNVRYDSESGE